MVRSKRQNQKCISPSLPSSQTELHSFHPNGAGGWGIWFVASSQHLMFAAAAHPSHTLCLVHCRVPPMGYGPSKTVPVWVFSTVHQKKIALAQVLHKLQGQQKYVSSPWPAASCRAHLSVPVWDPPQCEYQLQHCPPWTAVTEASFNMVFFKDFGEKTCLCSWNTSYPSFFSDWGGALAAYPSFSSTWFWYFLALRHLFTDVPPAQLRDWAAPCSGMLELAGSCWNQGNPWPLLKEGALQHTAHQQQPHHPPLRLNSETVSSKKNSWTTNTNTLERNRM